MAAYETLFREICNLIDAHKINCAFDQRSVLADFDATLKAGQVTSILGPNGAGKSTLLSFLCGAQRPDSGEVRLLDKSIYEYSLIELAKKRAVLSQSTVINFPFTVMEIVLMGRNPYVSSNTPGNDQTIAEQALQTMDVLHLKDRSYPTLSGGEQQRVQLARVFAQLWEQEQACLFLDEPTSALDLKHQHQVLMRIRQLCSQKKFMVCIVMHDLNLARIYSDQVILLKDNNDSLTGNVINTLTHENISYIFDVNIDLVKESYREH